VGGERLELSAGDIAVLPWGDPHGLASTEGATATTEVIVGTLRCDELSRHFLQGLPRLLRVHPGGSAAELLEVCLRYLLEESSSRRPGAAALLGRLPELLLVEVLRLYAQETPAPAGWLTAEADPIVGRALRLLHASPAYSWTVAELAIHAATSRTVLSERFRRVLGLSPIQYVTEWRMQVAAGLMRNTRLKLDDIAERTGYRSHAAFSRAFHRCLGISPSQWRSQEISAWKPEIAAA
jgi:AraC-like DNA-binding protein